MRFVYAIKEPIVELTLLYERKGIEKRDVWGLLTVIEQSNFWKYFQDRIEDFAIAVFVAESLRIAVKKRAGLPINLIQIDDKRARSSRTSSLVDRNSLGISS